MATHDSCRLQHTDQAIAYQITTLSSLFGSHVSRARHVQESNTDQQADLTCWPQASRILAPTCSIPPNQPISPAICHHDRCILNQVLATIAHTEVLQVNITAASTTPDRHKHKE